jgi:hypothetical protein
LGVGKGLFKTGQRVPGRARVAGDLKGARGDLELLQRLLLGLGSYEPIERVPLKAMCSTMWATPPSPGGSSTPPTSKLRLKSMTGAKSRTTMMTRRPLASVVSWTASLS